MTLLSKETFIEGSEWLGKLLCQEPGSVLPERPRLSQVIGCPGLRMEAEGAGRVPARLASFWPGDPCSVSRSPATPEAARAARDALPAASRSPGASPLRGCRGQLCLSAILKPSDIFHRDREVGSRGNGRVSAPSLCRSTRRGRGGGRQAGKPLLNCNSIDNEKNHHHL